MLMKILYRSIIQIVLVFGLFANSLSAQTITSFSPTSGPVGTAVTITGTNFSALPSDNIVYFGAARATVVTASPTQLVVSVPSGSTYKPITVEVNGLTTYSILPFLATLPGAVHQTASAASFSPTVNLESLPGLVSASFAIGDLDGDGKPDLAAINGHVVSIYQNTSTPEKVNAHTFAAKIDFAISSGDASTPYGSIAIGDLNGDGRLDLAIANGGKTVSVLRNTTTGPITFANEIVFPTALFVNQIAIGDLNLDGKPDLAVTTTFGFDFNVAVLRNISTSGSIAFDPGVDFPASPFCLHLAIGDINNDGKPEIITDGNSLSILKNNSTSGPITSSSFSAPIQLQVEGHSNDIAIGDIDGDLIPDLIVAVSEAVNYVSVFRNTNSGSEITASSFASAVKLGTIIPSSRVIIGDIDADGKPDIAVTQVDDNTSNASSLGIFRNLSTPGDIVINSFAQRFDLSTNQIPHNVAISDIDGDGRPDLLWIGKGFFAFQNLMDTPVISSFVPTFGPPGQVVVITGTNFEPTAGNNVVTFNGQTATVTTSTASTITTSVPTEATTGPLEVRANGFAGTSSPASFKVTRIASFFPMIGAVGSTVTITGFDFDPTATNNLVYFNGILATVLESTSTTITTKVPTGTTTGPIEVVANSHISFSATNFTFVPITFIPAVGPTGTTVVIYGINFDPVAANNLVYFDGKPADVIASTDTTVTATVPAGATTGSITVTALGISQVSATFFVIAPLQFSPVSGPIGSTVTIPGINFDLVPTKNIVFFGATRATVVTATATQLTVRVPSGATYEPISVLVNGRTTYSTAPFITTFQVPGVIDVNAFGAVHEFQTGVSLSSLAISDLDKDGKPDLVLAGNGHVAILPNKSSVGANSFGPALLFSNFILIPCGRRCDGPIPFDNTAMDVAVGDLGGDGNPDVTVANFNNFVSVFNIYNATPSSAVNDYRVDLGGGHFERVAIADIDVDGMPDLIGLAAAGNFGHSFNLIRNTNAPGTVFPTLFEFSAPDPDIAASGVASGDLDGDGRPDVVATNYNQNTISALRNKSVPGTISAASFATKVDFATKDFPYDIAVGDLDLDGKLDLVVTNESSTGGSISVFHNESTPGVLSFATKVDFATGPGPHIAIGDLNGDGKPDLAVNSSTAVSLFQNTSTQGTIDQNSFAPKVDVTVNGQKVNYPGPLIIGDLDGDSKPDLILTHYSSAVILRNTMNEPIIPPVDPTDPSTPVDTTITGNLIKDKSEISIYPNPAHEQLFITGALEQSGSWKVMDLLGRESYPQSERTGDIITIDTHELPPGIYFLRANDGKKTSNFKFMKE
jgi:FG-GAP-like repeat/IPT/TIG domain/Secretion system C-terminal sorting domain